VAKHRLWFRRRRHRTRSWGAAAALKIAFGTAACRCASGCSCVRVFPCHSPEDAFKRSTESITGPISRIISKEGMPAVYDALDAEGKAIFRKAYSASFKPALDICYEIYEVILPSTLLPQSVAFLGLCILD
jgi:hypothetical protein